MRNSHKQGIHYGSLWRNHKKIRSSLIALFGKCFWCKIPVRQYPHEEVTSFYAIGKHPTDEATLDHVKSRYAGRKKGEVTAKVLCCWPCNMKRALEDEKKLKQNAK